MEKEKQIIELDGTLLDTLYTTVEKGNLEDGTPYEKRKKFVPRTFEKAVQDENGTLLSEKLKTINQQISSVGGNVVGNIENLSTAEKETLVGAINEVNLNQNDTLDRLIKSGIISQSLAGTQIKDNFTFNDLVNREEITFFTNWTDYTNFPCLWGSGVFIPGEDTRCNSILYITSPIKTSDQKSFRRAFIGHVNVIKDNNASDFEEGVEWRELITNDKISNPNLLINSNFKINQRGKTEYRGNEVYTVDRWIIWNAILTPQENGISIIRENSSSSYYELRQYIEIDSNFILGKSLTGTVCVNGKTYSFLYEIPDSLENGYIKDYAVFNDFYLRIQIKQTNKNIIVFQIYDHSGLSHIINWVKLEYGTSFTPYIPPDKTIEFKKCKRYYQEIVINKNFNIVNPNDIHTYIKYYDEMRILPSPVFKNNNFNAPNMTAIVSGGGVIGGFSFSLSNYPITDSVIVSAYKENHGLNYNGGALVLSENNPLCLNAEIYL